MGHIVFFRAPFWRLLPVQDVFRKAKDDKRETINVISSYLTNHLDTGKLGEKLAAQYLTDKAFTIVHTNWRHARYEVDIIASCNGVLHFIEVKTRRSVKFGLPEESVTDKKLKNLINAAEVFLEEYPGWKRVQFDVLSITLTGNSAAEYFFIEDVYL